MALAGNPNRSSDSGSSHRGNREEVVIATKVGQKPGRTGLSAANVRLAADESLRRLQTDHIDLYYAHVDDPDTPIDETLGTLAELVDAGKVRYTRRPTSRPPDCRRRSRLASGKVFLGTFAIQPEYNLMNRDYEQELAGIAEREGLGCLPYFGLAKGFLTGKYRREADAGESARGEQARTHFDAHGERVLAALDDVAATHGVPLGTVALAWLSSKPSVVAPLATRERPTNCRKIAAMATLDLSPEQIGRLDQASAV